MLAAMAEPTGEIEIELKVTVRAEDLDRLRAASRPVRAEPQVNVYYDSPDLRIGADGGSCRVRITPGHAGFTLKKPIGQDVPRRCLELPADPRAVFPPGRFLPRRVRVGALGVPRIESALLSFGVHELVRLGAMRCRREIVILGGERGPETALDTVRLPDGTVFHEVEVEAVDGDLVPLRLAAGFIGNLCPGSTPSDRSKYQRFLEVVARQRGPGLFPPPDSR
jgi:hypothetical protein